MESNVSSDGKIEEFSSLPEQQLRAWINTVLYHAAIRWRKTQHRQLVLPIVLREEEVITPWTQVDSSRSTVREWVIDCLDQLDPREQAILRAVWRGNTQIELARIMHCDSRTIRRSLNHIRQQCPYW